MNIQGSADRIVSFVIKETKKIKSLLRFGKNGYRFVLEPTVDGGFSFLDESAFFTGDTVAKVKKSFGTGHKEARLKEKAISENIAMYCYKSIARWKVYHFHDTSDTAGVKRLGSLHDNIYLRFDASNLAAFLYKLQKNSHQSYQHIRKTIQLAIPFFDDFEL